MLGCRGQGDRDLSPSLGFEPPVPGMVPATVQN
jgi:hypothetical protein